MMHSAYSCLYAVMEVHKTLCSILVHGLGTSSYAVSVNQYSGSYILTQLLPHRTVLHLTNQPTKEELFELVILAAPCV